ADLRGEGRADGVHDCRTLSPDKGLPLARYTPPEIKTIAAQSVSSGHSPSSAMANNADNAGTRAPKAAPPEAPSRATARPYRTSATTVTTTPWKIACTAKSASGIRARRVPYKAR